MECSLLPVREKMVPPVLCAHLRRCLTNKTAGMTVLIISSVLSRILSTAYLARHLVPKIQRGKMPLDSAKHRIIFQVSTFIMIHFFLFNSPHFFNTKNALSVPGMDPGFVEFVIPSRGISLVRPGEDIIVLPGRSQSLVIYFRNTLHKNAHF